MARWLPVIIGVMVAVVMSLVSAFYARSEKPRTQRSTRGKAPR